MAIDRRAFAATLVGPSFAAFALPPFAPPLERRNPHDIVKNVQELDHVSSPLSAD